MFEYKSQTKRSKLRKYRKNILTTDPISLLRDRTEISNDATIQNIGRIFQLSLSSTLKIEYFTEFLLKLSIPMSTTPSFKFYLTTSSGANLYRSVLLLLSKNSFFRIPKYRKRMITPSPRQFEWKRNVGKKKKNSAGILLVENPNYRNFSEHRSEKKLLGLKRFFAEAKGVPNIA